MKRVSTLLCLSLLSSSAIAADDWKLLPLEYNNPGLKVDLGVGLWAWPMPLDYDNDGDMDLLVACPDKPSRGVYFFENASQNPKEKMPVFKAGKRIGDCTHNFQISHVGKEARVLKPGYEYRRDKNGRFDFSKATKIYHKTNIHENGVRANMWRHVDFDGDGDHDLIVGTGDWTDYGWDNAYDINGVWHNGPLRGNVYLIENQGNDQKPDYSKSPHRIKAAGTDIEVYGWPSPNFADFDGDGDLDLLCGEFLDGFTYFKNIGTRKKPEYATGLKLNGSDGRPLVMDLQMITPTAVDWDADGDLDLVVGDEDGRVALVENTGALNAGQPVFRQPVYFQQEADTLKFGALATPFAADWDGDGDEDILCGNTAGYIGFFENLGKGANGRPRWAAPTLLDITHPNGRRETFRVLAGPSGSIQGPCEAKWGYTTLSVADWDNDKDLDIIYNSIWSRIGILRNEGGKLVDQPIDWKTGELPPKWYWWQTERQDALTQWRTTPLAHDWNGDGKMDLVCLDQEGYLTFRPRNGAAQRIFIDEDGAPIQLNNKSVGRSGRYKLALVDWDQDGRMDLLVNSENATWYRNCADSGSKVILKKIGNLAKRNVAGHTSSPAACDFDQDGKPDLLVGAENGRLYYLPHDDGIAYAKEQITHRAPKKMSAPKFPGWISEDFVFTKAKFPQCHASTICETSRGLVVAWFGGTKEKAKDVGIWVSYNDGGTWSGPKEVANGVQYDGHRWPTWNPVLYQPEGNAPTLLFFKTGPTPSSWWGEMMISHDRGRTWSDRRRLPEGIDGPVRCKPILLSDGKTLLCGTSTETNGWTVHFEKVALEHGQPVGTWKRIGPIHKPEEFNAIQPTFMTHPDGTLQVLCRTKEGVISTSYSKDEGDTWSTMEATNLPNNNSGIEVVTLKDGRHLLIYNHLGSGKTGWGRRGLLNLAISDDGKEWRKVAVLEQEEKAEFSYPAIIQTSDGLVHLTYTWKRQRIKHVVVDPSKIKAGEKLSLNNWHD